MCQKIGAGKTPLGGKSQYVSSGIPLIREQNVHNNGLSYDGMAFITQETNQSMKGSQVFAKDLLMNITGGSIGRTALIIDDFAGGNVNQHVLIIRLINSSFRHFVHRVLHSDFILGLMFSKQTGDKPGLSAEKVNRFLIPIPPLAEQQRIVEQIETLLNYVDIIDTDAETLEKSITLAKQKILDLAIRGKLVPQDPADEPASELLKKIKAKKDTLVKAGKIKKDKHESYIFKSDDNCYYEQLNGKTVDITAEIPFELPESWCWCRLRSLGQIVGGGTPSTTNQMFWNGSIPWLSPSDLTGYTDMYIAHGKKSITEEGIEKSSAVLMPAGSVLYSSRAPIGYVVISKNLISTNQGFKSLVPAVAGMSEFYYFVLKARTSDIKQRATGTTFKEISGNDFGNTLVPLPPITEQKRIVQAIAQYNSILELISK